MSFTVTQQSNCIEIRNAHSGQYIGSIPLLNNWNYQVTGNTITVTRGNSSPNIYIVESTIKQIR